MTRRDDRHGEVAATTPRRQTVPVPGDMVAERAGAEDDEQAAPRHARPSRRSSRRETRAGLGAPHPGRTPALLTLAVTVVLVGVGWLTQGRDDTPTRLAVPMGTGSSAGDDDDRRTGEVGDDESTAGTPLGVTRGGEPAYVLANWLDVPLVAPATAIQPDALGTLIPLTRYTGVEATGTASGDGTTTSGTSTGSGSGTGSIPSGDGTTVTTARPSTGTVGPGTTTPTATTTPTTAPAGTTPTTAPPDSTPTTAPPDTTPPDTTPPPTEPPATTVPPAEDDGGLLDIVDDILTGTVDPLLGP